MIEKDPSINAAPGATTITRPKKVLRMVKNDRMGGSVPSWQKPDSAKEKIQERLGAALTGPAAGAPETRPGALAYNAKTHGSAAQPDQEFGFSDLVDMANPLHHVPVIGHVYRGLTGDEIKPVSRLVGGALFGGPIGAAGSLVNIVVREETGKDIAGNAFSLALKGERPALKSSRLHDLENPENRLNRVARNLEDGSLHDLPGALLTFADLNPQSPAETGYRAERIRSEHTKTAYSHKDEQLNPRPALDPQKLKREPLTSLALSPMPPESRRYNS